MPDPIGLNLRCLMLVVQRPILDGLLFDALLSAKLFRRDQSRCQLASDCRCFCGGDIFVGLRGPSMVGSAFTMNGVQWQIWSNRPSSSGFFCG